MIGHLLIKMNNLQYKWTVVAVIIAKTHKKTAFIQML